MIPLFLAYCAVIVVDLLCFMLVPDEKRRCLLPFRWKRMLPGSGFLLMWRALRK